MTRGRVDLEALRSAYGSRNDFKLLFDYFAERHKNSRETKVDRILEIWVGRITRKVAIKFFRLLENAGCGKFIAGRLGRQSRFSWAVGLSSVGKAASGHTEFVEDMIPEDDAEESVEAPSFALKEPSLRQHKYHLRPDLEVTIGLPTDLTVLEANRLAEMVKTLPFSGRASEDDHPS